MKILMFTPYPPIRDGIASYALQQVKALRDEGHEVQVLSPQPSAAHFHLDLHSPRGPLALLRRARKYDKVIIQFHPDFFYRLDFKPLERLRTTAQLGVLARSLRNLEIVAHEVNYELASKRNTEGYLTRAFWRNVDRIMVHTEAERAQMSKAIGLPPARIELLDHGSSFMRRVQVGQAEARQRLGVPIDQHIFLSIGFVQEHKGFDRAVAAFAKLQQGSVVGSGPRARLYVVGSVRVEESRHLSYVEDLRTLVQATPNVELRESYVSDELFDLWLVAADTVVLPYRHIWSSGVLERAALYDRQVIATRVGGLEAQAPVGTILVSTDAELASAMQRRLLGTATEKIEKWLLPDEPAIDWAEVVIERGQLMAALVAQASQHRGSPLVGFEEEVEGTSRIRQRRSTRSAKNALARFEPLALPPTTSVRPGVSTVKRAINKLTAWQLRPIVERINELTRVTAEALDEKD